MNDEVKYCTNCGAQGFHASDFCIECGANLKSVSDSPVQEIPSEIAHKNTLDETSMGSGKTSKFGSRKKVAVFGVAVLLSFVVGAGLTSMNALSAIIGKRYTEKQLKVERRDAYDDGYDSGYNSGESDGFSTGKSEGYSSGYRDGCNSVFDRVDSDQLIAIYYPYNRFSLGQYYSTRQDTC